MKAICSIINGVIYVVCVGSIAIAGIVGAVSVVTLLLALK